MWLQFRFHSAQKNFRFIKHFAWETSFQTLSSFGTMICQIQANSNHQMKGPNIKNLLKANCCLFTKFMLFANYFHATIMLLCEKRIFFFQAQLLFFSVDIFVYYECMRVSFFFIIKRESSLLSFNNVNLKLRMETANILCCVFVLFRCCLNRWNRIFRNL